MLDRRRVRGCIGRAVNSSLLAREYGSVCAALEDQETRHQHASERCKVSSLTCRGLSIANNMYKCYLGAIIHCM